MRSALPTSADADPGAFAVGGGPQPPDLRPYVPRLLLDWQERGSVAPVQEVDGTLVFIDLSGFTAMSERLARAGRVGAEEVADVIGSTFTDLLGVAYAMGGSLLKFGGDALLLLFQGTGHAARGTHAAFQMRRTLNSIGRIKTSRGTVRLRMSAGVHSAKFHFFIAGRSHQELVVTGPEVSMAVSMEAAAAGGEIVISPTTAAALGKSCWMEDGDRLLLREDPHVRAAAVAPLADRLAAEAGRFVPAAIRRHVAGGGSEPEHRQVTVAFIHFDGVDHVIASRGAAELADRLDRLVTSVQQAVAEHDLCFLGTDVDHDGGKIIVLAGAPQASENDDERMLRALEQIRGCDAGLDLLDGDFQAAVADPSSNAWAELNALLRAEVSQATGMLVAQLEIDPAEALVRLRAHAYATGRSATDVARDILDRRLELEPD